MNIIYAYLHAYRKKRFLYTPTSLHCSVASTHRKEILHLEIHLCLNFAKKGPFFEKKHRVLVVLTLGMFTKKCGEKELFNASIPKSWNDIRKSPPKTMYIRHKTQPKIHFCYVISFHLMTTQLSLIVITCPNKNQLWNLTQSKGHEIRVYT